MLSVNGLLLQVDKLNVGKVVSRIQMAVTTTVDEIDIKKTCRVCLMKYDPEKLFCLFGVNKMFEDLSIASAILDCFGIELKQEEKYPSCVCIQCASSTLQSYTFKKCLIKCQGILEKRLGSTGAVTTGVENKTKEIQGILYNYLTQEQKVENNTAISTEEVNQIVLNESKCNDLPVTSALSDHSYFKEVKVEAEVDSMAPAILNPYSSDNIDQLEESHKEENYDKLKLSLKSKATQKRNELAKNKNGGPNENTSKGDHRWWLKAMGPPYECQICGRKYGENFRPFYMHVRAHHVRKLPCTYCGKRFMRDKLVIHLRSHTNEKPYLCSKCPARFTIEGNLKRHLRCHTGEKLYVCDVCGKAYTQSTSLHSHKQRHTGQTCNVCVYCGKTFTSDSSYRSHMYNHHRKDKFLQAIKFGESNGQEQNEMDMYKCELCGRGFRKMMALHLHSRAHSQRNTFQCTLCSNRRFSLFFNYQVHMYWHQVQMMDSSDGVEINCRFCDEAFYDKSELAVHVQAHMEKPFGCSHCDKTFYSKGALSHHSRQHSNDRPFACDSCGKTFRYAATLKQHIKVHTGEKPYKCDICFKSFAQQQQLASHGFTHTGEKKYVCPFCGKAFALNGNLTVHKRRHTGETPYVCDICGKGFYDSSTMKKHKLGQHKDSIVNDVAVTEDLLKVKDEVPT